MEYWDFWSCWDHKGEQILHHSIDHHHTNIFQLLYFFFPIYWPFSITVIWNAHLRFPRFFKTKMFVYIFARFFTWHEIWQNRDGWCSRCGCHQGCCLVNSLMFHGLIASSRKWLHKDYVITVSFTCNRLFKQMFYCWIPKYNCARSFLCRVLEFRFFITFIQSLSFFFIIIRTIDMGLLTGAII